MSITWTNDGDGRSNLGPSVILQAARASFGASDYVPGGYPVYAGAFGLSTLRGLIPLAYQGTTSGYVWEYIRPTIAGPAVSNPGYLKVYGSGASSGGVLTEVSASSNFSGGTADFAAYGY